ncbi:hypothetical protein IWW37_003014 [Coemansia sp. RSA 2050]|nr:hypothetical protein IWW37_003014 [Coemansia sp. RSA 2050]
MSRSPSPCPSDSSSDTQYTNSLVHVTITFPELSNHGEDCDYECFSIDPLGDTIDEVIGMIAKRLHLEPTEFFFKGRGNKSCHEFEAKTLFAEVFYSKKSIERIKNHDPIMPLHIRMYDNPAFKRKGVLRWAMERELAGNYYSGPIDEYNCDGMLDARFEFHIAALSAISNVPAVTMVADEGNESKDVPAESMDIQTKPKVSEESKSNDVQVRSVGTQTEPQVPDDRENVA